MNRSLAHVGTALEQLRNLSGNRLVNGVCWVKCVQPEILIDGDATDIIESVLFWSTTIDITLVSHHPVVPFFVDNFSQQDASGRRRGGGGYSHWPVRIAAVGGVFQQASLWEGFGIVHSPAEVSIRVVHPHITLARNRLLEVPRHFQN